MDNRIIFKIKISNKNGDKPIYSDLSHILFATNNPRFTLIPDQNINLIDFLKQDDKTQDEILKKLINCEGDFLDFYNLIKSISDNGFMDQYEQIFVIQKNSNDFIVVEGNRRIMCLKLLLKLIKIPEYNETFNIYSNEKSFNDDEEDLKNSDSNKKRYFWYRKIVDIIEKTNFMDRYKETTFTLIENDNDLWKFIYSKHLTGERIGMRKWSRAKNFADLIKWFGKNGCDPKSDEVKNLSLKINRDVNDIKKDFQIAQFLYACFYFGKKISDDSLDENEVNFGHKEILDDMSIADKISALEKSHSFNKVAKLIKNYLKISDKVFQEQYINIEFDKKNSKIKFCDYEYKSRIFLKFLYDKWKSGELTTRPFKNENEILREILLQLKNINICTKLSYEKLNELDEFSLSVKDIDKLLEANECQSSDQLIGQQLERFKYAQNIKLNVEKLHKWISDDNFFDYYQPNGVFKRLVDQLTWNLDQRYLNAVCCSLRSFYEQILIWTYISLDTDAYHRSKMINDFAKNKIIDIWRDVKRNFIVDNNVDSSLINKYLNFLKINNDLIKNKYQVFFIDYLKKDGYYDLLNSGIHASHRIYFQESYNQYLAKIMEISKLTDEFYVEINWSVFKKLNDEIMAEIAKQYGKKPN